MLFRSIRVQSVNGPAVTSIQGRSPTGSNAVRCAYVGTSAALIGFTLTNGATLNSGSPFFPSVETAGGGVCCENNGVVSNCVLIANSAYDYGGGGCLGES